MDPTLADKQTNAEHYRIPTTPEERQWLKRVDGYRWSNTSLVRNMAEHGFLTVTVVVR